MPITRWVLKYSTYPLIRVRVSRFFGPDDLVKVFTDGSKQYDWGDLALT